jgi:hypothetical protein
MNPRQLGLSSGANPDTPAQTDRELAATPQLASLPLGINPFVKHHFLFNESVEIRTHTGHHWFAAQATWSLEGTPFLTNH